MTSPPSGLASISSRLDDTPHARGAVDIAMRLRRAEALSKLAEMDAPLIGAEPDQNAIDEHVSLVLGSACRSADRR